MRPAADVSGTSSAGFCPLSHSRLSSCLESRFGALTRKQMGRRILYSRYHENRGGNARKSLDLLIFVHCCKKKRFIAAFRVPTPDVRCRKLMSEHETIACREPAITIPKCLVGNNIIAAH